MPSPQEPHVASGSHTGKSTYRTFLSSQQILLDRASTVQERNGIQNTEFKEDKKSQYYFTEEIEFK